MTTESNKKHMSKRVQKLVILGVVCAFVFALAAMIGCAPSESAPDTSGADSGQDNSENTQPVNWTMETDCTTCHLVEADSLVNPDCPQAYLHNGEADCIDCHTEEGLLAGAHEGLTFADADNVASSATLKTVPEQTCIDCHGTLEELAPITAESTVLTDDQGTTVNPHERPAGATHEANPSTCTDCHKIHSDDTEKDAMKYCASCHHRGIFTCGNCHEVRTR